MKQQLKQTQIQIIAPQLRQSLIILSLPMQGLREAIKEELDKNPVLEEIVTPVKPKTKSTKEKQEEKSLDGYLKEGTQYKTSRQKELIESLEAQEIITKKETLQDELLNQLRIHIESKWWDIGQEIIGNIDESGYLTESIERISKKFHISFDEGRLLLKKIQEFEPKGVASRNLEECLLIQAKSLYPEDLTLVKIIKNHLPDVGKKKFNHIAKKLKTPLGDIKSSIARLQGLNPKPGTKYTRTEIRRITPDAIVTKHGNKLTVYVEEKGMPKLVISQTYKDLLEDPGTDQKTRDFIKERLEKANDFIRAIAQRKLTIKNVINLVVKIQKEALLRGMKHIKPLKMQDIATKLDLHQTTISRVIMNKFIKTPYGTFSLKSFFSGGVKTTSGKVLSSKRIKAGLIELIQKEDKHKPLNDDCLANMLNKKLGIKISRRTITKYRKQLKILSSFYRKQP